MSDELQTGKNGVGMFRGPEPEKSFPTTAVAIASVALVILVAVLLVLGRKPAAAPTVLQPAAAYASSLELSRIEMSEADAAGGKLTYIDGHVANHGNKIVSGITVQAVFANDTHMPAQIVTLPLTLIRMREPYVDTQPVSAAPLAPGAEADFRLIVESVAANWNQQQPEIHVTTVTTK